MVIRVMVSMGMDMVTVQDISMRKIRHLEDWKECWVGLIRKNGLVKRKKEIKYNANSNNWWCRIYWFKSR